MSMAEKEPVDYVSTPTKILILLNNLMKPDLVFVKLSIRFGFFTVVSFNRRS